jgi:aconitase B
MKLLPFAFELLSHERGPSIKSLLDLALETISIAKAGCWGAENTVFLYEIAD